MTQEYEERLKRKTYALTLQLAARHTKVTREVEKVESMEDGLKRMFESTDTDSIDALVALFEAWEDKNYRLLNRIADLREECMREEHARASAFPLNLTENGRRSTEN